MGTHETGSSLQYAQATSGGVTIALSFPAPPIVFLGRVGMSR